jgi:hypothetical protein
VGIRRLLVVLLAISSVSLTFLVSAKTTVTGVHAQELKSKCKNGRPKKTSEYNEVLIQAKVNALRSWAASKSVATSALFSKNQDEIIANIDEFLLNTAVDHKCKDKSFQLKVKGLVDENKIALLGKASQQNILGPRSRITAVFLARKAASVKSYQEKKTSIQSASDFAEGGDIVSVSGSSASSEGFSSTKNVTESGGSTVVKADKITWDVFRPRGLDVAVNQTFSSFGFKTIEVSQVASRFSGFDLDAFTQDYTFGDNLEPGTLNNAFDAIAGKIPLLVISTVDVGQKDLDPVSGEFRVFATVTAQVYKDDGFFYETVASVAPAQYYGTGPNETVAETNALILAAEAASTEIVQQLNAAGIQ